MILHLCSDEKFIDYGVIDLFTSLDPNNHIFVVISNRPLTKIRQIEKIIVYPYISKELIMLCKTSKAIVVHMMDQTKAKLLSKLVKGQLVLWCSWGWDFYNEILLRNNPRSLYLYETYLLNKELNEKKNDSNSSILSLIGSFRYKYLRLRYLNRAYRRVTHLSTILPNEFKLYLDNIKFSKQIKYIDFSYGNLNIVTSGLAYLNVKLGNKIIIGNSCTLSCNHLDVFKRLKQLQIERELIVPLSYGDMNLKNYIMLEGRKSFEPNIQFLEQHLSIINYNDLLISCSVMIMNHLRQQAVGNILIGLALGMKVYLNKRNPVYSFLKDLGVIVYDFEKDFKNTDESLSPLSIDDRNKNRSILEGVWGEEAVIRKTKLLLKVLKAD